MGCEMSKADAEAIIKGGGSVIVHFQRPDGGRDTRVCTTVEDLPPASEFSEGDPDRRSQSLAEINEKIARLQGEAEGLKAAPSAQAPVPSQPQSPAPPAPPEDPDDDGEATQGIVTDDDTPSDDDEDHQGPLKGRARRNR